MNSCFGVSVIIGRAQALEARVNFEVTRQGLRQDP